MTTRKKGLRERTTGQRNFSIRKKGGKANLSLFIVWGEDRLLIDKLNRN
jgi:hypothetical protein